MSLSRLMPIAILALAASVAAAHPLGTFTLGDVELLDSPFKQAMERNAQYLLDLDPDRLLHNTRLQAGLEPKGALYGGWESRGIAGHTLGHYLTALSLQYSASGDRRFRERIDYIVGEMAECQRAYGDGYVGALPPTELATLRALRDGQVAVKDPFTFASGAWVPWYTQHKILTGLKDAWTLGGSTQAREVTLKLADWVAAVTAGLSPAQLQTMLQVEHGGMREALVDIYSLTGVERYLQTAQRFYHHAVLDPLREGRDDLPGKHANTQIPKVTGAARSFEVTGDASDRNIALTFWKQVVREHSWVIGGNSDGEFFFQPDTASQHLSAATAETCNTYNMLRLTGHLFAWQPQVEYADYYERALYNHILASQDPQRGMFTYFMSLKPGHYRTYSTPFESFWCCVGSGMENHTKYGEAIYFHSDDDLYVNLFIPSRLHWREQELVLEQHTAYPRSNRVELRVVSAGSKPLTMQLRVPAWADGPLAIELNGERLGIAAAPGTYAAVTRQWRKGDRLAFEVPMTVRTEPLRGAPDQLAFLYGPYVLAGDLGPAPRTDTVPYAADQLANLQAQAVAVPMLAAERTTVLKSVHRDTSSQDLTFRTRGIGRPDDITLRPFVDLPYQRYNVYWTLVPR